MKLMVKDMRKEITACLIVKDEASNIRHCLDSIEDICDEIIVIDTGSTDETLEILSERGIEPTIIRWEDDFSYARNIALEKATKEFILSIDADEVLINPSAVLDTINNTKESIGGWLVEIASPASMADTNHLYFGKNVRLFRNNPNIRYEGIIHEQIAPSIKNAGLLLSNSKIMINHRGYFDKAITLEKHKRNLALLLKAHEIEPDNPNHNYYAGKSLMVLKEYATATAMFQKALDLLESDNPMRQQVLNAFAHNELLDGDFLSANAHAKESIALQPRQMHAYLILGETEFHLGNYEDARKHFKSMLVQKNNQSNILSCVGDYIIPPEEVYFRAGKSALANKQHELASADFKNGLKINPSDVNNITGLANVMFKLHNFTDARNLLAKALKIAPKNTDIANFYQIVTQKLSQGHLSIPEKEATLSVCMIVKNEEEILPKCLNSIKAIADEIIIVDTGSTDKTKEIAKSYGAKLFDFAWIDDFSEARNVSLMHATMDWILYIDADEILVHESTIDLKHTLGLIDQTVGAIICTIEGRQNNADGTYDIHRGGYPRIFRNYGYPAIKFTGAVHEQITPSLRELDKQTMSSNIMIEHSGYDVDPETLLEKVKRNYKLLIAQVHEDPRNPYTWHQLGQTLGQMKLNKEAEHAFLFANGIDTLSDSLKATNSAMLSHYAGNRGDYQKANFWAEKAVALAGDFLYARYLKAYTLLYLKRYDEAEKEFLEALKLVERKNVLPSSGYDIVISRSNIIAGYDKAKNKQTA